MIAPAPVPSGVLSLVGEAARRQREVEGRCLDALLGRGFELVHLPVLEYAAEETGPGYRFLDPGGRLLALRTDFTPLAARALARCLAADALPLEVCYSGEVVRPRPASLRRLPELYQVGFESYGVGRGGPRALEVLLDLLAEVGLRTGDCHLTVSEADLAGKMLAQLLEEPPDEDALELARVRDLDGLRELAGEGRAADALEAALMGEPPDGWAAFFGVEREVERMQEVARAAAVAGLASSLDVAPRLAGRYYHGVVFSLLGRATGAAVAGGGEYRVTVTDGELPAAGACLAVGLALEEAGSAAGRGDARGRGTGAARC